MGVVTRGLAFGALAVTALAACERHDVKVEAEEGGRAFSRAEKRAAQEIADAAARDVRALLPTLPRELTLSLRFGKDVIPETGETATTISPATVVWTVDPDRDVLAVIRAQLRPALFHELHHVVRAQSVRAESIVDAVVTEGMATAFERDFGKSAPPWGVPPPEAMAWTRELLLQPPTARRDHWLIRHPDGRRWIGMRVGTFLVDRASKASGGSAATMVAMPTEEILRLAHVD